MLDRLPRILRSTQQHRIRACGSPHGQLVEREALAAGFKNPSPHRRREPQRGNGHLGDLEEPVVVRDGADDDDRLALVCFGGVLICGDGDDARDAHRRSVRAGHEETAKDGLVEG